jgi:hypothetical protein
MAGKSHWQGGRKKPLARWQEKATGKVAGKSPLFVVYTVGNRISLLEGHCVDPSSYCMVGHVDYDRQEEFLNCTHYSTYGLYTHMSFFN